LGDMFHETRTLAYQQDEKELQPAMKYYSDTGPVRMAT